MLAVIVRCLVYVRQVMMRLLCLWLLAAYTAGDGPDPLADGVARFVAAYEEWDGAGLETAAETLSRAPESHASRYWRGVIELHRALFFLGEVPPSPHRPAITAALDRAQEALMRAIELDPKHGESRALLSTVYGLSISLVPARAMWLGPRLLHQENLARRLSPDNPRVLYLAGMNRYYGPSLLGGKNEGLKLLLAAEKLFAVEAGQPAGPVEPRWGHSTCLVYIGKTYDALGKPAEAEQYYRKALQLNSQDKLAKAELEKRKK